MWRASCTTALADPEYGLASPQTTLADRKRIKELEHDLQRKYRTLAVTAALLVLSKRTRGDLQQGRRRMIGLEDRQALAQDIGAAHSARARLRPACEIAGNDMRTMQRWKAQDGLSAGDGRPQALRHTAGHALSPQEVRADRILTDGSFAATPRRQLDDDSQPRLATRPAVCEPLSLGGCASRRDCFARCHVPNSVQARIGAGGQGAQQWPRPWTRGPRCAEKWC